MTTVAQAAAELDINERVIVSALLSNPDPALYNTQTGEISKQGMELLRERIITPDEMRSAKDALINSLPGAFETGAAAVGNFANTFIYDLGLDYYANYAEEVRAVTPAQTLAVTKKYLMPQNLIVVAVGDRKAIEPELQKLNIGAIEIRDADGNVTK